MNLLKHTKKVPQPELTKFIDQLQEQLPQASEKTASDRNFIEEYRQLVALTFGANTLFKGVGYANRLHNHVVHVCYSNSLKLIIQEELEPEETKKMLLRLKTAHNQLLQCALTTEKSQGLMTFYQTIGGSKKKHKVNQQVVFKLYTRIKEQSAKNSVRFCWAIVQKIYQKMKQKKACVLWQLKSYTWK